MTEMATTQEMQWTALYIGLDLAAFCTYAHAFRCHLYSRSSDTAASILLLLQISLKYEGALP